MNECSSRPIGVDLFAGAGGMTLGFEQAGFDVLAAVEIDPIHCATHDVNFSFGTTLCRSVAEVTGAEIRQQSAIGDRQIDVVFGGPPCQGFSSMGKRQVDDPRNSLIGHFVRVVLELRPCYFVMENVKGITSEPQRRHLDAAIAQLNANGYDVELNYQVLNAAHYGVPQDRKRLFLLGCQQELPLPQYPQPLCRPAKDNLTRAEQHLAQLPQGPTVWEALGDLPEVDWLDELFEQDWIEATYGDAAHPYSQALRGLLKPDDDFSYTRDYDSSVLTACARTRHTEATRKRFLLTPRGSIESVSRFLKLNPNGICNTLRAGTPSNRGAFTSPRPIHPLRPRCITIREAARLHSYPDWFRFHTTKWHGCRQIGNSVPPLLAKAVAAKVMQALGYDPTQPRQTYSLGPVHLLEATALQATRHYGLEKPPIAPRQRSI